MLPDSLLGILETIRDPNDFMISWTQSNVLELGRQYLKRLCVMRI